MRREVVQQAQHNRTRLPRTDVQLKHAAENQRRETTPFGQRRRRLSVEVDTSVHRRDTTSSYNGAAMRSWTTSTSEASKIFKPRLSDDPLGLAARAWPARKRPFWHQSHLQTLRGRLRAPSHAIAHSAEMPRQLLLRRPVGQHTRPGRCWRCHRIDRTRSAQYPRRVLACAAATVRRGSQQRTRPAVAGGAAGAAKLAARCYDRACEEALHGAELRVRFDGERALQPVSRERRGQLHQLRGTGISESDNVAGLTAADIQQTVFPTSQLHAAARQS